MKKPGLQELNIQVDTEATQNTIIQRDPSGRAKVAAPSAADDIATKAYVDAVNSTKVNYTSSKAPTDLSPTYPGGYSVTYILPTDNYYNDWIDLANSLMGSAYSYERTLMFVLKTDKAPTHCGATQELVVLSNFTASSGQIFGVFKRSVSAYNSANAWGPWVRVDRGITYGTANPSGGRDGDIYFQYE
ncbi:hypothetical protein I532_01405 [Brevibacillus borstelensis AK1]|uniref:Uncharacterized protein n=1 Tax=Brevibacillus borstelensis AK1 TaxID=1300222 RepID=M8E4L7_9BACL|nr:hypothetical protein [Brevibacillus borstelensis]EMT54221.1 hypothetical protein I532_01405 [Brevibacillus borstelensis AK1]